MSDYPVTRGARPGDPHLRLRLAALTAVIVGVILVASAAFLLSYSGIHQIALQAGVSARLARPCWARWPSVTPSTRPAFT